MEGSMMKRKIIINQAKMTGHKLILEAPESIEGLIPAEQILVDSDNFSFIYLMEDKEDYTYIVLPEQIWNLIKTAGHDKAPVFLTNNNQEIELINFHDELEYVVSNIMGNSNYGREMVTKVEGIF